MGAGDPTDDLKAIIVEEKADGIRGGRGWRGATLARAGGGRGRPATGR